MSQFVFSIVCQSASGRPFQWAYMAPYSICIYLFILLAQGWGLSGPRNRESLFGLVSHGYGPPSSPPSLLCLPPPASYPAPYSGSRWICLGADLGVIVHGISITMDQSMSFFSWPWNTEVLFFKRALPTPLPPPRKVCTVCWLVLYIAWNQTASPADPLDHESRFLFLSLKRNS